MHHQVHGLAGITGFDGIDQLHVLVIRAVRTVAALVLGNNQRRLRHQTALKADQRRILRRFGQLQVELARQANTRPPIAPRKTVALVLDHLAQLRQIISGSMHHRQLGNGLFNQSPGQKHLARFFYARARHHCTTIRAQQHNPFMGQTRQGATNNGAAHAKDFAQSLFTQLGARRQTLFKDRLENMRIDNIVLGSTAAGLASAGLFLERLQLFVHGHSCGKRRRIRDYAST
ncbi:hypothetical protein PS685_03515 [Pseudomonas fluorescens]|uniref:Uncharacterized protein n=1 Tax=Pseudomonas fluorescens TaxID=294 RepID=A0A5E6Z472_PSEFL|nr:hypothetical protein PS685_03515 [Pseudomonas fluorescens]